MAFSVLWFFMCFRKKVCKKNKKDVKISTENIHLFTQFFHNKVDMHSCRRVLLLFLIRCWSNPQPHALTLQIFGWTTIPVGCIYIAKSFHWLFDSDSVFPGSYFSLIHWLAPRDWNTHIPHWICGQQTRSTASKYWSLRVDSFIE